MTPTDIVQQINEVQLVDVQLHSVAFQSHKDTTPPPDNVLPRWKLDYSVQFRQAAPTELHIKLRAQVTYAEEETAKPFDLTVELVGVCRAKAPIPSDQIPSLIRSHSAPLLWPYLREVVADITARAGGPAFVIPTLKITIPPEEPRKATKKSKDSRSQPRAADSGDVAAANAERNESEEAAEETKPVA